MPRATCIQPIAATAVAALYARGGKSRRRDNRNMPVMSVRVAVPSTRWSNCTVVGFSVKLRNVGDRASMSLGIHRSAIFGNELYISPASSPATNAPERAVKKTAALVACAKPLKRKVAAGICPTSFCAGSNLSSADQRNSE
uniref:Uncharacterized protein n=1 Tax=Anopheles christyi TaxID=43041 RepID=A0A182KHZ5_9DIPT